MGVRFAPSPTGAFHVGNLRTAWISWLWSRELGEPWVVRFEDIDSPRVKAGAREGQLSDLKALGMEPDELLLQTDRHERHEALFERAREERTLYPCYCSRKDLRSALDGASSAPHRPDVQYNGRCRDLQRVPEHNLPTLAWRFRGAAASGEEDFIVGRTDPQGGAFVSAYHWACAIDDADGSYALLVRARDLAPAARIQRTIQSWLSASEGRPLPPSAVFHCALVIANDGSRLEKRTEGVTLAELSRKHSPQQLLTLFERSFDIHRHRFERGKIFGEAGVLTLSALGL